MHGDFEAGIGWKGWRRNGGVCLGVVGGGVLADWLARKETDLRFRSQMPISATTPLFFSSG